MLQSLINKDNIIKRELLEVILKTNNDILYSRIDFILKYSLKVKDLETFISSAILLNKNNYFGTYSLNFNREILESVTKKDKDMFLKIFSNPMRNEIFNNEYLNKGKTSEIKYYYDIEKIVYFYLYQKKYYDCFYEITLDKIQELKTEIYKVKNIDLGVKYFSNKNTISVRKGKETITSDIVEVIYKTEYIFIKSYLERF